MSGQQHALRLYPRERDPIQVAEWAPAQVWTTEENLSPTGIRSPDQKASSQSLYRFSYPDHDPIRNSLLNTLRPAARTSTPSHKTLHYSRVTLVFAHNNVFGFGERQTAMTRSAVSLRILPDVMNTDIESGHTNDVIL